MREFSLIEPATFFIALFWGDPTDADRDADVQRRRMPL
jgi:hypothetical protein